MFLGEYNHTIDDKGRLTIPAKYRGDLAAGLVVTRGLDQNLVIYTLLGWEELAARVTSQAVSNPKVRNLRRRLFSAATDLIPDRQGRVLIPQQLRDFAGINGNVVVAGNFDSIEIWSVSQWQQRLELIENPEDDTYFDGIGI